METEFRMEYIVSSHIIFHLKYFKNNQINMTIKNTVLNLHFYLLLFAKLTIYIQLVLEHLLKTCIEE